MIMQKKVSIFCRKHYECQSFVMIEKSFFQIQYLCRYILILILTVLMFWASLWRAVVLIPLLDISVMAFVIPHLPIWDSTLSVHR